MQILFENPFMTRIYLPTPNAYKVWIVKVVIRGTFISKRDDIVRKDAWEEQQRSVAKLILGENKINELLNMVYCQIYQTNKYVSNVSLVLRYMQMSLAWPAVIQLLVFIYSGTQ